MPNTKVVSGEPIASRAGLPAPLLALSKQRFGAGQYANSANYRRAVNLPQATGAMSPKPLRRRTNDTALKIGPIPRNRDPWRSG